MPSLMRLPVPHALTRRTAIAAFALLGLGSAAQGADPVDRLGLPGPLSFDGTSYALAWSSHPTPIYYKQEYLPAGENLDGYSRMLIVELIESGTTPESAVAAQIRLLNARKGKDPLVNFAVIQNKQSGETLLDFLISERTPQGAAIAEWNAYRYVPRKAADGRAGVMLFAISQRAYGDADIKDFLGKLKTARPAAINRVAQHKLPALRVP